MADILLSVGVQTGSAEFSSFISDLQSQIRSINDGKDTEIKLRPTIDSAGFSEIKDQLASITSMVDQINKKDFAFNLNFGSDYKERLDAYKTSLIDVASAALKMRGQLANFSGDKALSGQLGGMKKDFNNFMLEISKTGEFLDGLEKKVSSASSFAQLKTLANEYKTVTDAVERYRPVLEAVNAIQPGTVDFKALEWVNNSSTTSNMSAMVGFANALAKAFAAIAPEVTKTGGAVEAASEATKKIAEEAEETADRVVAASEKQATAKKKSTDSIAKQEEAMWAAYRAEQNAEAKKQAQIDADIARHNAAEDAKEAAIEAATQKEIDAWNRAEDAKEAARQKAAEKDEAAAAKQAAAREREAQKEAEAAEKAAERQIRAEEKAAAQREAAQTRANTQYENQLYSVESALKRVEEAQERCVKSGFGESSTQYQGLENLKANLEGVKKEILEVGELMKGGKIEPTQALDRLSGAASKIKGANTELVGINRTMIGTGSALGMLESRLTHMLSLGSVIMLAARQIKNMAKTTIELDSAMTQLRVVTNASESDYEKYGQSVAGTAKEIGASITDLIDSTTVYARLGYTLDESSNLAKYTAMLSNVGDIDVSTAQDALTAITKAFKDVEASNIEAAMDKMVAVGNNFPISVSQIAEGMNNAGSALAAAGNSFQESIALLTAANTTVQNVSKSSTGLRTITARIRGTKLELDELGETIEVAKYQEALDLLTGKGVKLTQNGEFRSTYDILKDIASVWNDLSNMEQANIAEQLAGKICCCCPGALMKCA